MTNKAATRLVVSAFFFGSLVIAPALHNNEPPESAISNRPPINALAAAQPQFQMYRQTGELTLSGHTMSLNHERELLRVANVEFSADLIDADFQPLGIVPDHWQDTSIQVLRFLIESTESGRAVLLDDIIMIRGIAVDKPGWNQKLDALRTRLSTGVSINADTLFVDPAISANSVCRRTFAAFDPGPINFIESSAILRSSAFPRLERVIALADTCGNSAITLIGHTDSSGDGIWNQKLSLQRANAVGNYIVSGGIDRSRLKITGAGASAPIADNGTRYGRGQNRRIEITLSLFDSTSRLED